MSGLVPALGGASSTAHRALFPAVNGLFPAVMSAVHLYSPVHKSRATFFLNSGFSSTSVLYSQRPYTLIYIFTYSFVHQTSAVCYVPGSILFLKKSLIFVW